MVMIWVTIGNARLFSGMILSFVDIFGWHFGRDYIYTLEIPSTCGLRWSRMYLLWDILLLMLLYRIINFIYYLTQYLTYPHQGKIFNFTSCLYWVILRSVIKTVVSALLFSRSAPSGWDISGPRPHRGLAFLCYKPGTERFRPCHQQCRT